LPDEQELRAWYELHLADLTQQAVNQQRAEIAFFAIAGAAAVLGTGLWLLPKSRATAEHAAVLVPVVAPAAGGLLLRGDF